MCSHGALGQWLFFQYSIRGDPFPDPEDWDIWMTAALFPAAKRDSNISYSQMLYLVNKYLKECELFTRKKTHLFRVTGARVLDDSGLAGEVII